MSSNGSENDIDNTEIFSLGEMLQCCSTCAILTVDDRQIVTGFNPAAECLTGIKASSILQQPMSLLPPPLQKAIQDTIAAGNSVEKLVLNITRPGEQSEQSIQVSITAMTRPGNGVAGAVAIFNSYSAIQRLEQGMRQFDRLASIGTLSASMAHEIKNAMVGVKTFVELLQAKYPEAELAGLASRELTRIDSIARQMLKFAGPARPTYAPVRLHEIIGHALHLVEYQLDDKNIALTHSFAALTDEVRGDHYQLEQAFINLFFNSIEAMKPGMELSVKTSIVLSDSSSDSLPFLPGQPLIRVTVQDTGAGIPEGHLDRVFDPFFTTKQNGTGMGLSITRRIIQEHKGTISVESEPGKGSTFTVLLPALHAAPLGS